MRGHFAGGSLDGLSRCGPGCKNCLVDAKHGVHQRRSISKPSRQLQHPQQPQLADSTRQGAASSACPEGISTMALWLFAPMPNASRERRPSASRFLRDGRQERKEGMLGTGPEGLCGCRCPRKPRCGHPGRPAGRPGRGHSVPAVLCLPRTRCLSPCLDHLLPGHLHHTDAELWLLLHLCCFGCLNMQTGPSLDLVWQIVPHASHVGCHN